MRRSLVGAVLLMAGVAHAEPLALSGSFGLGLVVGPIAWDGPPAVGFAGTRGEVHQRGVVAGVNLGAGLFLGKDVTADVVMGLAVDGSFYLGGHSPTLGYTTFSNGGQFDATVRAVLRPSDLVVRVGAGASVAAFGGSSLDVGASDNVATFERLIGPVVTASVGWQGAALELRAGYLLGPHTTYVPITLSVRGYFGRD